MRLRIAVTACAIVAVPWLMAVGAEGPPQHDADFFETRIRPVLVEHCYRCHSAAAAARGTLKAALQLDTRAGLLAGGDGGPALVAGRPEESLIVRALRHDGLEMPPEGRLPATVVADFERWIRDGAVDPRTGAPAPVARGLSIADGRGFWSLSPLQRHELPPVADEGWCRGRIDRFIQAAQEAAGIRPAGDAEPQVLVRRLYFDLVGLPPTPEEVAAFVADPSAEARTTVVDRLLATQQFGEKWARHWLDSARYAESNGKDRNVVWHHAWRYRDWVIDAINRDLPHDEFIRDQIAGDLRGGATEEDRTRRRIAVGFLALGPKGLAETNPAVFRMDMIDEQIDVIGRSILGLSIGCARCHDHKFDAVPTRDYYALAGILGSTQPLYGGGPRGIKGLHDTDWAVLGEPAADLVTTAREHLELLKRKTQERNDARSGRYRVQRRRTDVARGLDMPAADRAGLEGEIAEMDRVIADWNVKVKALEDEVRRLETEHPPQPEWAMSAREAAEPGDVAIHIRGDVRHLADKPPRGMLQVVPTSRSRPIAPDRSGRLELAEWLVDPLNPLTPRVRVNRVWQEIFGRGLVATPDDFGVNGARPSHPELLDDLAAGFVADGWSLKRLIRGIVLSRTYGLASAAATADHARDPDNVLLWRHVPRRLPAEAFRDAVLAVAGRLDMARPARSVVGDLPPFTAAEFDSQFAVKPDQLEHRHRSVYLPIIRGNLPESLRLFDFPDPSMATARRDETIMPSQAAFLLNSGWMIAQAASLADRVAREAGADDAARIERLHWLAYGRPPTAAERRRAEEFLGGDAGDEAPRREAWTSLCQAVLSSSEFRYSR